MSRFGGTASLSKGVLAAAILAAAMLAGAFAYDQSVRRAEALAVAERQLQATADLLANDMARTLEAAHKSLIAVDQVRHATRARDDGPAGAHAALKAVHANSPVFVSLVWTDDVGERVASSFFADPPPLNLAHTAHFKTPRDDPRFLDRPFVGPPMYSEVLGTWILPVTLRMEDASGAFAGVSGGAVDPAYFSDVYALAGLGATSVVRLMGADGVVLAQHPFDSAQLGKPAATPASAGARLTRTADVSGAAITVTTSIAEAAALASHSEILAQEAAILSMMLVAFLTSAAALSRTMRRREALEERLRERAQTSRDYARAASDWFWETDRGLRMTSLSGGVEASLNLEPERIVGRHAAEVLHSDVNAESLQSLMETATRRQTFRAVEFRNMGAGRDRTLLVSGTPYFDREGAFMGYRGSATDVTERRRAEQRFRDAIESFPGRVTLFDKDERLILFNQGPNTPIEAVEEELAIGDTFEESVRKLVAAGLIDDARDAPEAWIARRVARFRLKTGAYIQRMGGKYIQIIERPMADGGAISLRFDVTEREQAVAEAEEARRVAERASQAKSDFLANMSHEFRTPLNAVIGFSQMLQLRNAGNLTDVQRDYVDHIEKSGQHLLSLVSEVLDLAAMEAGQIHLAIKRTELAPLLLQAVSTMRPVAEQAGVTLRLDLEGAAPAARADPQRLRQILLNLLSNGIKYNRAGGNVRVVVASRGPQARIVVEDDGIGIAPEYADQAFTPFNRLGAETSAIEGAGVGLALSQRLADAMDGRIGFESAPGEGSTFWLDLPVDLSPAPPAAVSEPDGERPPEQAGYTLLYVEDNPASLSLMEHLVETLPDVTMRSAPSGQLGVDLARAHRPDIIVLDVNLPGMSGLEALRTLKTLPETRAIPVIALSAAASARDIERGLAAGFFRYVTKPLDVNRFIDAIEAALQSRLAESSRPTAKHPDTPSRSGRMRQ